MASMNVAEESRKIKLAIWGLMKRQAEEISNREPLLVALVRESILQHPSYKDALIYHLAQKLADRILGSEFFLAAFKHCLQIDNGMIEQLAMEDLIAVETKDPACKSIAQVFLYFKGYKSIQCYRLAHVLWVHNRRDLAMVIQARCTEVFGVDIHPGALIGGGLMIDHGTGVVIGETAIIGRDCSFLHGITLGGTCTTQNFDRHPKIGNSVFLGCNVTVLGNIHVGDHSTVGANSLVLKSLPAGCTAVGSPAHVKNIDLRYARDNSLSVTLTQEWALPTGAGRGSPEATSTVDSSTESLNRIKTWTGVWTPKTWYDKQSVAQEYLLWNYEI